MKTNVLGASQIGYLPLFALLFLIAWLPPFTVAEGAEVSWRELRMNRVHAALEKNRKRFRALELSQERYLAARAADPRRSNPLVVVGRFYVQAHIRTTQYLQEVAKLDRALEEDYQQWSARTGQGSILEWQKTISAQDLEAVAWRGKISLGVAYKRDMKKLEREVLQGQDGILDKMDHEREEILQEHKTLLDELEFLRTHREEEVRERPSLEDRYVQFFFLLRGGKTERTVNLGDQVEVEFIIIPGSMATRLTVKGQDREMETHELPPTDSYKWSCRFTSPGNHPRLFILEDKSIPVRSRMIYINFYVPDTSQPAPAVDGKKPLIRITSHNAAQPWSRVSEGTITLSGTATDKDRGGNGIHAVYVNHSLTDRGGTAAANDTAGWSETLNLHPGWNKMIVEAYDHSPAFNKAVAIIWIFFDSSRKEKPSNQQRTEPPAPSALSAELDCGNSFELAPGDFAGRGCSVVVHGWADTDKRVFVNLSFNARSGIEVFPGNDSQHPMNMHNPGISDYSDRYIFAQSFRARENAPPGITTVTITVSQEGSGTAVLRLRIAVLAKGLIPSLVPGIRPPARVATGSGGAYCVWRYKSFGDRPECFNFVRAACQSPRYAAPRYELVGSGMTWRESGVRMAQLGSYHEDAYGCHRSREPVDETPATKKPATTVALISLVGKSLGESKKWLEENNLKADLQSGSPAPSAEKTGFVEKQEPGSGTRVERGSAVSLTVYSPFVETRRVPDVLGLSAQEAQSRLQAAGLKTNLQDIGQPPSPGQAGRVQKQDPQPGYSVAADSAVALYVYGSFVAMAVVPDLRGLSSEAARIKLETAGLAMARREAGRPNQPNLAQVAQKQDPAAGTRLAKGQAVLVWFYGPYTATREEQIAQTDCSGFPGSRAYWDESLGKPQCGCFDGLQWNLAKTRCVSADVQANELCARDFSGSIAKGRTADGKINCDCPEGYIWNTTRTGCEKQLSPEELCGRNYPGSVPQGRTADGKVNCACPNGYAWTADNSRCVKKTGGPPPQDQCHHLITQIRQFMGMYRRDPRNNSHIKGVAEMSVKEAQRLGCDQNQINQALATGDQQEKIPTPFKIAGVGHPSTVEMGGKREDLSVTWSGTPTFPVKMFYFRKGLCPRPFNCVDMTRQFSVASNPLHFPGALGCTKIAEEGNYFFDYAVVLEDSSGNRTQEVAAGFTCKSTPNARCAQYARKAVSLNQENLQRSCKYTGSRWTNDYQGHYNWCLTASPSAVAAETHVREEALKKCQDRPKDCSHCQVYQQWLDANARACNYHGARLPSICSLDPECLRWNQECNRVKKQLQDCLNQCQHR
jgi:hypothetical protein